jgi:hypothetical protein
MGGWSTTCPDRFTPGKETRYPLYRRLGGPQGQSRWVWKILPQPGFDPRTVQPVFSRYTAWAILAHMGCVIALLIYKICHTVCWNVWFHSTLRSSWHWCHMPWIIKCQYLQSSVSRRATSVSDWLHELSFEKSSSAGPCVISSLVRLLRPWRWKHPAYPKCQ